MGVKNVIPVNVVYVAAFNVSAEQGIQNVICLMMAFNFVFA